MEDGEEQVAHGIRVEARGRSAWRPNACRAALAGRGDTCSTDETAWRNEIPFGSGFDTPQAAKSRPIDFVACKSEGPLCLC